MEKFESWYLSLGVCIIFAVWQLAIIAESLLPLQEKVICGMWIFLISGVGAGVVRVIGQ